MKRILPKKLSALALAVVSVPAVWSQSTPPALGDAAKVELDSINAGLDQYESMARRSILSGGSKPVSFAGEAIGRIIGSTYREYPDWMQADATTMKNSFATLRVGMVAAPNRNLRLWSKVAFDHALLGSTASPSTVAGNDAKELPYGYYRSPTTGEAGFKLGSLVFEDMAAGAVAKIGPTTWSMKAGGVLWNELSPLTVWKIQPRIFAWDYLPFELEQSTAQFYDYGTIKGEKSGRAAWNKKPFQGIQLESVELPAGFYANGFWGFYEGYNKNQPWIIPNDKNTELQYNEGDATRSYATKGIGIADEYRWTYFGRLAKSDLPGGVTLGANWFSYYVDDNYPKQWNWELSSDQAQALATKFTGAGTPVYVKLNNNSDKSAILASDSVAILTNLATLTTAQKTRLTALANLANSGREYVSNYYVVPQVGSFDFRRNIPGGLNFHVDIAMSHVDSVFYKVYKDTLTAAGNVTATTMNTNALYRDGMREKALQVKPGDEIGRTSTGWVPGVYTDISYPFPMLEAELRSVYFPKQFQSPASVANPVDGIFPYESNMTGAGKFAGEDNGTAYASNFAGANLILKLPIPRGHAKVSWGLHGQVEEGKDMIYFPWRQNGEAYNYSLASDFTQYDQGLMTDYLRSGGTFGLRMAKRLGDEFYASLPSSMRNIYAPTLGDAGGERAAFMSVYEGFVPYKLAKSWIQLDPTSASYAADTARWNKDVQPIVDNLLSGAVSESQKFTQNLSFDASYEISRLWEGKRSVFLSGYLAFNSITKDNRVGIPAFSADNDNVLLMGRDIRFEPVLQVTPKFYLVGLIGNEIWKSNYGVAYLDTSTGKAPTADAANAEDNKKTATATVLSSLRGGNAQLVRAPIDYNDWIYGLGFNWDMASRVALNFRCQYFTHEDKGISVDVPKAKGVNDYKAWLTTAEVKMWF